MDLSKTAEEIGISVESYKRLYSIFLVNTDKDIVKLRAALRDHSLQTAADLAHHIKGAASNMDLFELASEAQSLQLKALQKPENRDDLLDHFERLASTYQAIKSEIEAQL